MEAGKLHRQALAIREKVHGGEHPDVANSLNSLATGFMKQGLYTEAEPLLIRTLAIFDKAFGNQHPLIATTLINLALNYQYQRKYVESERLFKRVLAIREKVYGLEHPHVAISLNNLAMLYHDQGRFADALVYARKSTKIYRQRITHPRPERSIGQLQERQSVQVTFLNHINILNRLLHNNSANKMILSTEGLEVSQLARNSGAAQALAQIATRFAAGGDAQAQRVREHQDTLKRWQGVDSLLTRAVSESPQKRLPDKEKRLRKQLAELDQRLRELETVLRHDFPEYAALTNPAPLALTEIQDLLKPDEAILSYLVSDTETYLFTIRKDRFKQLA